MLEKMERDLLAIGLPPAQVDLDSAGEPARWDLARDEDKLTAALKSMVTALRRLVPNRPVDREYVQIAAQIEDALKNLKAGLGDPRTPTTSREDSFFPRLVEELRRLRSLLITVWLDSSTMRLIKGTPTELGKAVDVFIEAASVKQQKEERTELERTFTDLGAIVRVIPDHKPFPTSISAHQWIVEVQYRSCEAALQVSQAIDREVVEVPVTLLWVAEDVVLPFGVIVSRRDGGTQIPLGADSIRRIPGVGHRILEYGETSEALSCAISELALASWKNARDRMRPSTWPAAHSASARTHLDNAIEIMQHTTWQVDEIVAVMQELCERVNDELQGSNRSPIAAELAIPSVLSGRESGDDSAEQRVARASLLAVMVDLHARTSPKVRL